MTITFPSDCAVRREMLLDRIAAISETLRASGAKSEELGRLAPEAVMALRDAGAFRMKLCEELGGADADPLTEMLVLENLSYHDLTSGWCTMVAATGIGAAGAFLPQSGIDRVFAGGHIPTASIMVAPTGRVRREGKGFRISGRWRFNSGIHHAEWVIVASAVEDAKEGEPAVIIAVLPAQDVTLYDNWGGVTGLRGTGSCDCSVENYFLPEELSFVWDVMHPEPKRGGPSYLLPRFASAAKEHGSVAIGGARRALDELIVVATTTRGAFRSSRLDERQVVQRFIAEADIKLRSARALMHERYGKLFDKVLAGRKPDGADIAEVRAICVYATDVAISVATMAFHFAGSTGLHHPHVLGRLLRDLNTAGIHLMMSDTAYETHGQFLLGLPANPLA